MDTFSKSLMLMFLGLILGQVIGLTVNMHEVKKTLHDMPACSVQQREPKP